MLTKILLGLAAVLAVFLIVVALQPSEFSVSRSATIAAAPAAIFPHVNEPRKWEAWNPWGKLDRAMKLTYDGPPAGVGAAYAWAGNNDVGEGRMTVTESQANERIRFRLEFFKPMAGVCDTVFTFQPDSNGTAVTWTMSGKNNFLAKVMCLFMSMDKMIGGQFEQGLATLKTVAESPAR